MLRVSICVLCCRRLKQWYDMVSASRLTKEQGKQLGSVVKDSFDVSQPTFNTINFVSITGKTTFYHKTATVACMQEWLGSEGHKKELLDLGLKAPPAFPAATTVHSHARPVTTISSTTPVGSSPPMRGRHMLSQHN